MRVLSKFEHSKAMSTRAEQLNIDPRPLVPLIPGERWDSLDLARREIIHKVSPIIIIRHLPDGTSEEWSVNDLLLPYE